MKRIGPSDCLEAKGNRKLVMLTAYDYPTARIIDRTGLVDIILVGDSLGMVIQGKPNTLEVTMDQMIYHSALVSSATKRSMVVGDMPFMSYHTTVEDAVKNAGRFIQEGGANAVKLEGAGNVLEKIEAIIDAGIPVMGHLGLTPQSINKFGGWKLQGKTKDEAKRIVNDAKALEKAGVFSIVLEMVPAELAEEVTKQVNVPTIGIGAGPHCDGQVLVLHDIIGLTEFSPSFAKQYVNVSKAIEDAVTQFASEVREEVYPDAKHSFTLEKKE